MRLKIKLVRSLPVGRSDVKYHVPISSSTSSNKHWLQPRHVIESSKGFFIYHNHIANCVNFNKANIVLRTKRNTILRATKLAGGILDSRRGISLPIVSAKRFESSLKLNSCSSINCPTLNGTLLVRNRFVSLQPIPIGNFLSHIQQKPQNLKMFSNIFTKLMSTINSGKSSIGSGTPIESDQEGILHDKKGNKQIKINACGPLYSELSKSNPTLFGKAPADRGIDFIVNYYDSLDLLQPDQRSEAPTMCLLHGAPGNYQEFHSSISYFTTKGFRVLAPNFPDYSNTFEHSFRHSPRERLEYLLNFFLAIQVKHIDILIGHSSSVYTIFELLNHSFNSSDTNREVQIKSLGLLNTPTYNLPQNLAATPFRMFTLQLFDYPLLRPIIIALIHTFVKLQGIRNRVDSDRIDNLLIAASTIGYSDTEKMVDYLKILHKHKVPTFALVGCNDKLIPMRCFDQLKHDLGIKNDKQVKYYNSNGDIKQDVEDLNELVEVSEFESGGHYTFQRFSQQVNEDIYNFLNRKVLRERIIETTKL